MCHGRRVPQGNQDLKWLPPESNALGMGSHKGRRLLFHQMVLEGPTQ